MKIQHVLANNHRKAFEVISSRATYFYPYVRLDNQPDNSNRISNVSVDQELAREAFTFTLESGAEETVHIDQVLDYNRDPGYLNDMVIYKLTIEAKKRIAVSPLSKREIIRRLGTSATQFYRLLDPKNNSKSLCQLMSLLQILDCEIEIIVRDKTDKSA